MRSNKAALLTTTTFATAASVSAGIEAVDGVKSQKVSEKISIVGTGGVESYPATSDQPAGNKDARSVLIRTEDGEEWPIEVKSDGDVTMKTEDGGEFPILP